MIQRIQSLYLFLAAVCCVLVVFNSPMMYVTPEDSPEQHIYSYDFAHLHEVFYDANNDLAHVPNMKMMNTWGLSVLVSMIAVLSLVNIFCYRKRIFQARLNILIVVACLGYYAMLAMYTWFAVQRLGVEWYFDWSAGMILVALVLVMMATRKILQDEALVRSADRLR